MSTLLVDGVNDIVQLSFYPVGGFSNPETGKTVKCASHGVDANCTGDIYESCILSQFCGGVSCESAEQLQLVKFLNCFEHENGSNMNFADSCAQQVGFDVPKIHACFDDETASMAAFDMVVAGANDTISSMQCFPWVKLDGTVISTDPHGGCLGEDAGTFPLLETFCNSTDLDSIKALTCKGNVTLQV